ncbi:beta family protein [Vibrio alginolyticus]
MSRYTPFLKFKTCEIAALKALEDDEISSITPFFDLATKKDIKASDIEKTISKGVRKYELNFKKANGFYIDDYDIDDSIRINGDIVYNFLISEFSGLPYIPVVGLDRTPDRVKSLESPLISSDTMALRLSYDDFLSYTLSKDDIDDLLEPLVCGIEAKYKKIHLIFDLRVCNKIDVHNVSSSLIKFIQAIVEDYSFEKIIISGSSIPASIADVLPVTSEKTLTRNECRVFEIVNHELGGSIEIGDYTTISPEYSDVSIPPAALRKIMTPKVIYAYDDKQYFVRGGALETHKRGNKQYDDMCSSLVKETFFRGATYSIGDEYIADKAKGLGKDAQPNSISKYLINAHLTYMIIDY